MTSILDYAGEVIGYQPSDTATQLHLKAIRAFTGVPKNSCSAGVLSEVDWLLPEYRTRLKMIRQYHRILNMDDQRLTKRVMLWDRCQHMATMNLSWSKEINLIFDQCGKGEVYSHGLTFHLKTILDTISQNFKKDQYDYLKTECANMSKLRTFLLFKQFGNTASHLTKPLTFLQRKTISKMRLGSLELRIESGRYHRPKLKGTLSRKHIF